MHPVFIDAYDLLSAVIQDCFPQSTEGYRLCASGVVGLSGLHRLFGKILVKYTVLYDLSMTPLFGL